MRLLKLEITIFPTEEAPPDEKPKRTIGVLDLDCVIFAWESFNHDGAKTLVIEFSGGTWIETETMGLDLFMQIWRGNTVTEIRPATEDTDKKSCPDCGAIMQSERCSVCGRIVKPITKEPDHGRKS